ncbi:hypothetical protein B9Z19DRAFT_1085909 [Tuber borchii]|uniref:Uncharacterized protein n=1 Tax=Tuber borchii TaxID=42251 RepID=A0A2T6ZQ64_TUBBO|nr:hypothetical protein B9Z19DRAFT_1085909 [Tuber borchii]
MTHTFWGFQFGSSRLLDTSSYTFKNGISPRYATTVRIFPVLDALSSISVSREKSQVIAVGLQMNHETNEIRLLIADNHHVSQALLHHLNKVWRKLQSLSDRYAEHRVRTGRSENPQYQVVSPDIPIQVAALKVEIFRDVYLYSLQKQMRRVDKWFQRLGKFVRALLERRGPSNLDDFEQNLSDTVIVLLIALKLVCKLRDNPETPLTDTEWAVVCSHSMAANENVGGLLADRNESGCEILAEELKDDFHTGNPPEAFALRRALVKLTALPQHIETLFGFAHSPRLRPALQYSMSIVGVPGRCRNAELPSKQAGWAQFLKTIWGEEHRWHKNVAWELAGKKWFAAQKYMCMIHCECKLIHYLETSHASRWDNVARFPYLGVSKLSCGACRIWISSFNELGGRQYYTRGSHDKWYWPWGMPIMGPALDKVMDKMMAKEVLLAYISHERTSGRLRAESESTGVSLLGAQHRPSKGQLKQVKANTLALRRAFGGDLLLLARSEFPGA